MREKLTVIIPTLNEERNIEDAIQCVSFADEIIVIDSFSSDNTVELLEKHNVVFLQRKFDNFSSQKNYAIKKSKFNWIYILDADERVSLELQHEILESLDNPKDFVGFNIGRTFYFKERQIRFGGRQRDKVIRLFRKDKCKYNGALVHERIDFNGSIGLLKNKIDHYSFQDYNQYVSKINLYTSLQAEKMFSQNKRPNLFHLVVKPPVRFVIDYIIRLGFLDGFPGFVLAKIHAFGVLSKYNKLKLLNYLK